MESYNIIVIDSLSYFKFKFEISTPSITIEPLDASRILNKHKVTVDFPAPVLPTTPIFSYRYIITFKPLKAGDKFSLYLTTNESIRISPT